MDRIKFFPEDYADLLGMDFLLVGGQAANLWATIYLEKEPALQAYHPLTSKDADLFRVGETLFIPQGWRTVTFPRKGRMRLITKLLVGPREQVAEVIRSINGLTNKELETGFAVIHCWGRDVMVLNPVLMFKAKAANVHSINQEGRQDVKHLLMMTIVARRYLTDLLLGENTKQRPKSALAALNEHLRSIQQFHQLEPLKNSAWDRFFPMAVLEAHASESVRNFHSRLIATAFPVAS